MGPRKQVSVAFHPLPRSSRSRVFCVVLLLMGVSGSAFSALSGNPKRLESSHGWGFPCEFQPLASFVFADPKTDLIPSLFPWSTAFPEVFGSEVTFPPFAWDGEIGNPVRIAQPRMGSDVNISNCALQAEIGDLPLGFAWRLPLSHLPVDGNVSHFEDWVAVQVAPIPERFAALLLGVGLVLASALGTWWGER